MRKVANKSLKRIETKFGVISKEKVGGILSWVYIAISNTKRQLINTFREIKLELLQNYLDEFCY